MDNNVVMYLNTFSIFVSDWLTKLTKRDLAKEKEYIWLLDYHWGRLKIGDYEGAERGHVGSMKLWMGLHLPYDYLFSMWLEWNKELEWRDHMEGTKWPHTTLSQEYGSATRMGLG